MVESSSDNGGMILLLTCSSPSNVGHIAARAALAVMQYRPGRYEWCQAKQPEDTIESIAGSCDAVIAIDGCHESCCMKKLSGMGVKVSGHIVVSELLGITKSMAEVKPEEVEKVVNAVNGQ